MCRLALPFAEETHAPHAHAMHLVELCDTVLFFGQAAKMCGMLCEADRLHDAEQRDRSRAA